jgi:hypothetical protein
LRRWISRGARTPCPALALLGLWCLVTAPAGAAVARIQYNQTVDDNLVDAVAQSLGPDRTLHFRYDPDFPDDHVFPNGVSMRQFHTWVVQLINAWNRQPLMPLRLSVERGSTDAPNTIKFDETGHDTSPASGVGGWGYQWIDSQHIDFGCGATINVSRGYADTHEKVEGVVKHELGHCLTLAHSCNRASVMTYLTQGLPWDSDTGFFQLDDLLGIRAVWARYAPSFGEVAGHLVYPDGSGVGGADVVALDADSGEVLASGLSDGSHGGRFTIDLLAGYHIRLMAHPLHADQALFGDDFIEKRLLTPGSFEPAEFLRGDRSASILVPNAARLELPPFVVTAPADPPLLNKDAGVTPMLPGERAHLLLHFKGLSSMPPQVSLSMMGLTADHAVASGDHVEFDVTASPEAAGDSGVEVRSGAAANFQVGRVWVRPIDGVIRVTDLAPLVLTKGQTTEVVVQGMGLGAVTGARVVRDAGTGTLPARLAGSTADGGLRVQVDAGATSAKGPWRLVLQTADGEILRGPEPLPRLWVGRGTLLTQEVVDGGDVILNQPARFSIPLKNVSSERIQLTQFAANFWSGGDFKNWQILNSPPLLPGHTGAIPMQLTPTQLGPLILYVQSSTSKGLEAVSEVRLWVIPKN